MDSLVAKKFYLKKREVSEKLENDILQTQREISSRGTIRSSVFLNVAFKLISESARENIDSLLKIYEDVGISTSEETFVIDKEAEIKGEVEKLVPIEAQRVNEKIDDLAKRIGIARPHDASYVFTNLQVEARDRAEILIETIRRRIQNKQPKKSLTDDVFVIMQIGNPQLDKIWKDIYVPVIGDFKLHPKRIDKHGEGRFLMSEVAGYLNNSKLVIADLTNARPNCYLEVGYTLGVDKNSHLILCAREDHNMDSPCYKRDGPKVHFDISGYDIVWWDENKIDDFKIDLAKKITYRLTVIGSQK